MCGTPGRRAGGRGRPRRRPDVVHLAAASCVVMTCWRDGASILTYPPCSLPGIRPAGSLISGPMIRTSWFTARMLEYGWLQRMPSDRCLQRRW